MVADENLNADQKLYPYRTVAILCVLFWQDLKTNSRHHDPGNWYNQILEHHLLGCADEIMVFPIRTEQGVSEH